MTFTWIKTCHVSWPNSYETLFKDIATGAKKWVIVNRKMTKQRIEFYGSNDEGPFESEEKLKQILT